MRRALPVAAFTLALAIAGEAAGEPPAADVSLYGRWCARCHGERGDGRGPAAAALGWNGRPPRDFTSGHFRWKSTPYGTRPTDDDLARSIRHGLAATAMPYFGDLLAEEEIARLVRIVRSFAASPLPAGEPIDLGPDLADSAEARRRGAALYASLGCPECHGANGRGDGPARDLRNPDGSPATPTDLGRPWAFRGGADARAIALRLATGIMASPMPAYLDAAPVADLWAVAHHVRSLAIAPSLEAAAIAEAKRPPGAGVPLTQRGEYVTKSGTCFLCHVQMKTDGSYDAASLGAGGMPIVISHVATVYSRNLTPDRATGLGDWTPGDLRSALRDGRSRDGRRLHPLDMPWTILAGLDDRDVDAIHAFLATLPPARNLVPPPRAATLGAGLVDKAVRLATGAQTYASFHPGNAGRSPAGAVSPGVGNPIAPAVALVAAAIALATALVARRATLVAAAAVIVTATAIYTWPPLAWMPAGLLRADPSWRVLARLWSLPPIRPPAAPVEIADPDLEALVARGRYVATIGTCSLCHTAGPSVTRLWAPFPEMGGGMKVNWKVFGTTYSRNLTPDVETGLGGWTDAEIRRAVTSGIARDGRLMHWQAMPWDHFSNLSPEDLTALVAYLRHLPPAWSRVPDPAPPQSGDEEGDTFWFGYSGEYRR